MPEKKQPTVWEADPHTRAKIAILGDYLERWFQILGTAPISRGHDLIYVDGFSGPGEYSNFSQGSPISAIVAARKALSQSVSRWQANIVHCVFIEADRGRFLHLKERLSPFEGDPRIKLHLINDSFEDGIGKLKQQLPSAFNSGHPLFAFIDPFGAKGVPFALVEQFLNMPCSEILLNLDADGIARNFMANKTPAHERLLNSIFGNEKWKVMPSHIGLQNQCLWILAAYKENLRQLSDYVFSFEMRSSEAMPNYYLVFASQHYRGLEKMKEAMRKIDQDGSYRFCDTAVGQTKIFRWDDETEFAGNMHIYFQGQTIDYATARDYALNETPFINPKKMLALLESDGRLDVTAEGRRSRGTFNEEKIKTLTFITPVNQGLFDGN